MSERIGIVTGGGDCPGLNAVIRAVAKAAANRGWETIGFLGGYEGILEPQRYRAPRLPAAGAAPDPRRHHPGHRQSRPLLREGRPRRDATAAPGAARRRQAGLQSWASAAWSRIGGDGSLSIGQQLFEHGLPIVGVPKTIDNDLEGTVMTFGFDSAVACATDALDRLHTTAESHHRVMVLEVMGRYAGWIALYAGVAGGADVILIPEIPFTYDSICAKIRRARGRRASTSP